MWRARTVARCSIWCRQLVPEATITVPKGWLRTFCASGSATLRESSYFDASAPNAPAMPQQPVSSRVTLRSGSRSASRRMWAGSVSALAWQWA